MKAEEFLNQILDKILQGVPRKNKYYFNIRIANLHCTELADIIIIGATGTIGISRTTILKAENEAELAFLIGHEVGHVVSHFFLFPEASADHMGIKLMANAGYNTFCAIDILERGKQKERRITNKFYRNAEKYFRKDQEKWILFTPEDLEKVKEFLRRAE